MKVGWLQDDPGYVGGAELTMAEQERFWAKVERGPKDQCWRWTAAHYGSGYGNFNYRGTNSTAHRIAYKLTYGLPEGLYVHHLCRNRGCVNPAHLEAVSNGENVLRGLGITAVNARKTHCANGHRFDSENTYIHPTRGTRDCRICRLEASRRYQAKARA